MICSGSSIPVSPSTLLHHQLQQQQQQQQQNQKLQFQIQQQLANAQQFTQTGGSSSQQVAMTRINSNFCPCPCPSKHIHSRLQRRSAVSAQPLLAQQLQTQLQHNPLIEALRKQSGLSLTPEQLQHLQRLQQVASLLWFRTS